MQFDQLEQAILKTEADFSVFLQGEVQWIEKTASSWKIELTKIIVKERSESDSYGNCIVYMEEEPDLQIGNRIQIQGEMELFEQASNPGMYDQRAYYRAQNIRYYVWAKQWEIVNARINFIPNQIYQFRCQLAKILEMVAKQEDVGIMQAVVLGEKSELDAELKELYQEYGIAHILAVSGLHISCVGMLLYQLLRRITGSLKLSGWISAVFVIGYIILTGSNVSAIRAGVMFILSLIAKQKGKVYDMPSSLSTAVIIILIQYPLQLFSSWIFAFRYYSSWDCNSCSSNLWRRSPFEVVERFGDFLFHSIQFFASLALGVLFVSIVFHVIKCFGTSIYFCFTFFSRGWINARIILDIGCGVSDWKWTFYFIILSGALRNVCPYSRICANDRTLR